MKDINIFCFGFGQVARNLIKKLNVENFDYSLTTTSRQKTSQKKFDKIVYNSLQFDGDNFDSKIVDEIQKSTHILISTPPKSEDSIIKNFAKNIESNLSLKWLGYLSSTSVYGNHNCKWVNENTLTDPTSENGKKRLKAEQKLKKLNVPLIIFRLSGIYSNENNVLHKLKKKIVRIVEIENQIFSRIHVEDIANILFNSFSFKNNVKGEVFNISDNYPCSYKEVIEYGCKLLKVSKPKIIHFDEIEDDRLKDFYRDSKKINNEKMKNFFNYNLKFPTYVEGLDYIRDNFF